MPDRQPNPLEFWDWFRAHESELFAVKAGQEDVFEKLRAELSKFDPDLTFEFAPVIEGKRICRQCGWNSASLSIGQIAHPRRSRSRS